MKTSHLKEFIPLNSPAVNPKSPDQLLPPKALFTTPDIEKIFEVKKSTVEQWRLRGCGPKFVRLEGSRLIRYRRQDVIDFIESQVAVGSTTEADQRRETS